MRNRITTASIRNAESEQDVTQRRFDPQVSTENTNRSDADQRVAVIISDASQMTTELLASALGRLKLLKILKSTVGSDEAIAAIHRFKPDVAVVSAHQTDGLLKGFEVVRQARLLFARTRCVVLLDDCEDKLVIDAFRAGACGVFKRSASMSLLGRCISAVHSGQIWASSSDLRQIVEELERTMPFRCVNARGEVLLTDREQEIVPLVAQGLTNKEISSKLDVSEHTVKNHLFRMYEKLGISSRVELILYGISESAPAE